MRVVSGNYITAKRRGVINGVDYGLTGEVRAVGDSHATSPSCLHFLPRTLPLAHGHMQQSTHL